MFPHYNISKTFASIVTLKKMKKKSKSKTGSKDYLKKKSLENDPMRISMKNNDYDKWTRFALFIPDLNQVRNVGALINPKTESE